MGWEEIREFNRFYFCKRTREGIEEKVPYNPISISRNKSGLGITIMDQTSGEVATLHIGGLDKVICTLEALQIKPESLASSLGREVNAYKEGVALCGIGIPTFTREKRIS